jgi:hypothetical protein
LTPDEKREVIEAFHHLPAISIFMPFDPKMRPKKVLAHSLELVADTLERELIENYPGEMATLVLQKLTAIFKDLNYNTHSIAIAIYVSPVFERVLYLNFAVEEKVIIGETFAIRDLVHSKKQLHNYLILLLNPKESRIYYGNSNNLVRIVSNSHESAYDFISGPPGSIANVPGILDRKEIVRDKLLKRIDNSLDIILKAYPFPLFVMAPEKILADFKKFGRHAGAVIAYVRGDFEDATSEQLGEMIKPFIKDWERVRQEDILNQLKEAASKNKLVQGIRDVCREAINRKGRLLVAEKNFTGAAQPGSCEEIILKAMNPCNTFSYVKDAVDAVVANVLENGGDVEFVDDGLLEDYHRIALIQIY